MQRLENRIDPHTLTVGTEIETHTIDLRNMHIGRHFMMPNKATIEHREKYSRDASIGIEFSSRPYYSIREALFGIKTGLRKFMTIYHYNKRNSNGDYALFLTGTWRDRYAATHFHVGFHDEDLSIELARRISRYFHGHIPLLVALMANSPVYKGTVTSCDSNRFFRAEKSFFYPLKFGELDEEYMEEMTFSNGRNERQCTLEIRPCDANLPEYAAAGLAIVKTLAIAALSRKGVDNTNSHERHLAARMNAARHGPRAILYWNNRPLPAASYLKKFMAEYRSIIDTLDVPDEVMDVFRLFRAGWNSATVLRKACELRRRRHPRKWQAEMARDYAFAISRLLNGETLATFIRSLGLRPPLRSALQQT